MPAPVLVLHVSDKGQLTLDRTLLVPGGFFAENPREGFSDRKKSRISVVLPAPDGPVRNWKDLGAI